MTVAEALREAAGLLAQCGVPDARLDAELLLSHLLDAPRLLLVASGETRLTGARLDAYFSLVSRRAEREPLQYILGTQAFMGHDFLCAPCALIPRMDTETLCEQALLRMRGDERALDLCTGTGVIIISLKKALPGITACAGDISEEALDLARENARALGVSVDFRLGDLDAPFSGERFDVITCNPPYIPTAALETLQAEVQKEPTLALDGGADGLAFYRRLAANVPGMLSAGGFFLCEVGDGQSEDVRALLSPAFASVQVVRDLAGLPRVVVCQKEG